VECRSNAFLGVSTAGSRQTNTEKGFDEAIKRDEKGFDEAMKRDEKGFDEAMKRDEKGCDEAMKRELHVEYTHIECSSAGSR
jgi:hypothetical protein